MTDPTTLTAFADHGDAAAIIQAAREHADPFTVDPTDEEVAVFVVPNGARLERVEFDESYLPVPRRTRGHAKVEDLASLIAYVTEHYAETRTTLWVNVAGHRVVAVLDDDDADNAAWRDHRATLELARTTEWKRWLANDGRLMGQEAFAEHIEESELDIVVPDAAELLELAQTFHATTTSEFRQGTRLQSGEIEFLWVEEAKASAGRRGDLTIPATFELSIAPFEGEDRASIHARLRYRVREGQLSIGYKLVRPEDFERETITIIAGKLGEQFKRVYLGVPAGER